MQLDQLNLTYLANEDRILVRISLTPPQVADSAEVMKAEVHFYITRRLLQKLWPVLMDAIKSQLRLNRPEAAFASEELLNMDHEQALQTISSNGSFATEYENTDRTQLHGERPFLINTIKFHLQKEGPLCMQFITTEGNSLDLRLNNDMFHGFCKLLIDMEKITEWGLQLELPKPQELQHQTQFLN